MPQTKEEQIAAKEADIAGYRNRLRNEPPRNLNRRGMWKKKIQDAEQELTKLKE